MLRIIRGLLSIILIGIGVAMLAGPVVNEVSYQREVDHYIRKFEEKQKKKNIKKKEDDDLYWKVLAYNDRIYLDKQSEFRDAWSQEQAPMRLGTKDEEFGYIKVPSAKIKLPLYLGASKAKLRKGAAILGGTSIPIGMLNTNSVIAAHRGYQGIPYFRNIEAIKIGDKVIIQNPWEKLTYRVTDIDIIDPDDVDKVKIQDQKEMVTLMTCHPYRSGGKYRYIVYCSRYEKAPSDKKPSIEENTSIKFVPSTPDIKRENWFRIGAAVLAALLIIRVIMNMFRKE